MLYTAIQLIESYVLTPLIQRQAVLLPPVLTILAQVLLGVFVGGFGLMLATPLVATVLVLVKMLYIEDVLGEPVQVTGGSPD
jgi:predicted PurR-regulated permease PerM